jgi:hypothetical protein
MKRIIEATFNVLSEESNQRGFPPQIKVTSDKQSRGNSTNLGHHCYQLPRVVPYQDIPFADLKLLSFAIPL